MKGKLEFAVYLITSRLIYLLSIWRLRLRQDLEDILEFYSV